MPILKKYNAFTLVELSIVLVIIGLLTAGVVGGQSLIQSAERQRIVTNANGYSTALNAFKLEYDAVPGDMTNATSYWASARNGDGNGKIWGDGTGVGICDFGENGMAWYQLQQANIVTKNSISASSPGLYCASGTNEFCVKQNKTDYWRFYTFTSPTSSIIGSDTVLTIAGSSDYNWSQSSITATEAKKIDTKMDDGKANSGKFISIGNGGYCGAAINTSINPVTCTNSTDATNFDYDLTKTGAAAQCKLIFKL